MTIAHTTAIRNGLADLVADAHDTGSGTAVLEIRDSTTVLVTVDFQNPAFGAAAAGVATLLGTPIATTGAADGVADNFLTKDRDGTQILSGSVTGTGMGGDIEMSNVNVATSQNVSLEDLTYTAPA